MSVHRQYSPSSSACRASFFFLTSDIRPQTVNLGRANPIVIEQRCFDRFRVVSRFPQPGQDGIFLDPFGAANAADPCAFSQQRQTLQNILLRRFAVIQQCSFALIKGAAAAFTLKPLVAFASLPVPDDIPTTDLAIFTALWI